MNELFSLHLVDRQHDSAFTLERRRYWARHFQAFCAERNLKLEDVTRSALDAYVQALEWEPGPRGLLSPNTVYQGAQMLRAFLRWACAHGHLAADPTQGWLLVKATARERALLTRNQLEAILNSTGQHPVGLRDRAVLGVAAELGLIGGPCERLDLADLDLANYRLGEHRLGAQLAEHLHRYTRHGRPALLTNPGEKALFLTNAGKRMPHPTLAAVLLRHSPGHPVRGKTLHRSWLAHRDAFLNRRLPDS